jgi:DNA-binding SARP family transcriptional activator
LISIDSTSIDLAVLGPVEVRSGERRIDVGGDRQRRILAALLLNLGRTLQVSYLVDAAWGDDPPETARQQIHNGVWRLRRALARCAVPPVLHSEANGYRLGADAGRLDLARFSDGVAEGHRLAELGRPRQAAMKLHHAVSLWRGPALAGVALGPLEREAVRLEEMRLSAIEAAWEYTLASGGERERLPELIALVDQHPLRERLPALLMLALYRLGRQAEALAVYRRTAAALSAELGVGPGRELRHRYEAILHNDPALTA